jgi:hypothetical protein
VPLADVCANVLFNDSLALPDSHAVCELSRRTDSFLFVDAFIVMGSLPVTFARLKAIPVDS